MMKKILTCLCLVLALTGCVEITAPNNTPAQTENQPGITSKEATVQPAATETPSPEAAVTSAPTATALPTPETIVVVPIRADFVTETTETGDFAPDFAAYGVKCFFNMREVFAAENNPGLIGSAGLVIKNDFAWTKTAEGLPVLTAAVNADDTEAFANRYFISPDYGAPLVGLRDDGVKLEWGDRYDADDGVSLVFYGDGQMIVTKNIPRGMTGNERGRISWLAVPVLGDGTGSNRVFIPLYALVNELGGGVLRNPLGDGSDFIYTGDAITGYTGTWESSDEDETEYRTDVVIDGATVSVATYWSGLELRPDGTFTESGRYWQDEGDWVYTERKGRYAFFGRILAMCYETESEYRGPDYAALIPVTVDAPVEGWAKTPGSAVYARYVDEWDAEHLQIHDRKTMYSDPARTAAPKPGIKK